MVSTSAFFTFLACLLVASGFHADHVQVWDDDDDDICMVTNFTDVANATQFCTDIVISDITVPAGITLEIDLQDNATLTFTGNITFEYYEWEGPLVYIKGKNVSVQGSEGSYFNGEGAKYWNAEKTITKPKFIFIEGTAGTEITNITLLDCPRHCVTIVNSDDLVLNNWTIDSSAGDGIAANTDGFDIHSANNFIIENAVVRNQDDCIAVNKGTNMRFSNIRCYGGHGLSLSVGLSKTSSADNVVSNIVFADSFVYNSRNGIHIKTHKDAAAGFANAVTYSNIQLSGITRYGINVQEDYSNGGGTGTPNNNIPITGLTITNVHGTMNGTSSMPIYILCAESGCANFLWSDIEITGNDTSSSCNEFSPTSYAC